jgi:hypothetical protein
MAESKDTVQLLALMAANGYGLDKIMSRSADLHERSYFFGLIFLVPMLGMGSAYMGLDEEDPKIRKFFERLSVGAVSLQFGLAFSELTPLSTQITNYVGYFLVGTLFLWIVKKVINIFAPKSR